MVKDMNGRPPVGPPGGALPLYMGGVFGVSRSVECEVLSISRFLLSVKLGVQFDTQVFCICIRATLISFFISVFWCSLS